MKVYYHGHSKEDARTELSKNPHWADRPVVITEHESGVWIVKEAKASRIYNETLFVIACAFNTYLAHPETHPEFAAKLKLLGIDTYRLASKLAEEFESTHGYLDGDEYLKLLDEFIHLSLTKL